MNTTNKNGTHFNAFAHEPRAKVFKTKPAFPGKEVSVGIGHYCQVKQTSENINRNGNTSHHIYASFLHERSEERKNKQEPKTAACRKKNETPEIE